MHYDVRKSGRAKYMRLSVHPDGAVVVTVPHAFRRDSVERFVRKHNAWIRRALARVRGKHVVRIARGDIPQLKRDALALAHELCAHYAAAYGCAYKKISVRAQRSRWGSCSKAGNLSFNYKIAALPRHLAAYVIVHEVCHLKEFNHSARFWSLVAREVPSHKSLRAELRRTVFRSV